jgi:hypothetical protein
MRYQLRVCADQGGRLGPEERAPAPAEPVAGSAAGTAGLHWLWDLVELRLGAAEPDHAA